MKTLDPFAELEDFLGLAKSARGKAEEPMEKGGPFIDPRGGKYKDPGHKIPWGEGEGGGGSGKKEGVKVTTSKTLDGKYKATVHIDGRSISGPSGGTPEQAVAIARKKLSALKQKVNKSVGASRPIRQSTGPDAQREMTAYPRAQLVAKIRLGEPDVLVGAGIASKPSPEPEEQIEKSRHTQGSESLVVYDDSHDRECSKLVKAYGACRVETPTATADSYVHRTKRVCPACESAFMKSLTACPECGHGAVRPGVINVMGDDAVDGASPVRRPAGLRKPTEEFTSITNDES